MSCIVEQGRTQLDRRLSATVTKFNADYELPCEFRILSQVQDSKSIIQFCINRVHW
jgi:hypothetical protein